MACAHAFRLFLFWRVTNVLATARARLVAGRNQVLLHDVPLHPACDHQGEDALTLPQLARAQWPPARCFTAVASLPHHALPHTFPTLVRRSQRASLSSERLWMMSWAVPRRGRTSTRLTVSPTAPTALPTSDEPAARSCCTHACVWADAICPQRGTWTSPMSSVTTSSRPRAAAAPAHSSLPPPNCPRCLRPPPRSSVPGLRPPARLLHAATDSLCG